MWEAVLGACSLRSCCAAGFEGERGRRGGLLGDQAVTGMQHQEAAIEQFADLRCQERWWGPGGTASAAVASQ